MEKVGTIRDSVSRIGLGNILKFPIYSHCVAAELFDIFWLVDI